MMGEKKRKVKETLVSFDGWVGRGVYRILIIEINKKLN